jgi:hypothetical protein
VCWLSSKPWQIWTPHTGCYGEAYNKQITTSSGLSRLQSVAAADAGALWNLGLEPDIGEELSEAQAPAYLAHPVPSAWLASDNKPWQLPEEAQQRNMDATLQHPTDWDRPMHLVLKRST